MNSADHIREHEVILEFPGGFTLQCWASVDDRDGEVVEFFIPDGTGPEWKYITVSRHELLHDLLMTGVSREKIMGWIAYDEERRAA